MTALPPIFLRMTSSSFAPLYTPIANSERFIVQLNRL